MAWPEHTQGACACACALTDSLGGYLGIAYAERHASRVDRLVLVSPVGTPEPPRQLVDAHANAGFPFSLILGGMQLTSYTRDLLVYTRMQRLGTVDSLTARMPAAHSVFECLPRVSTHSVGERLQPLFGGQMRARQHYAHRLRAPALQ